jgi:hypothetical protein
MFLCGAFWLSILQEEGEELCNCEFSLAYGAKILLNNATMRLIRGNRYGLCGPNGVGKSTLMRAIANGQVDGFPPADELRTVYVEHDIQVSWGLPWLSATAHGMAHAERRVLHGVELSGVPAWVLCRPVTCWSLQRCNAGGHLVLIAMFTCVLAAAAFLFCRRLPWQT